MCAETDFTKKEHIDRELVLVKVDCLAKDKKELEDLFDKFVGKIIQAKDNTMIIESVGDAAQIKLLLTALDKFGVKELVRTGKLAIIN